MKTRNSTSFGLLRVLVSEIVNSNKRPVLAEAVVKTTSGEEYTGDHQRMYNVLLKFGTSAAEREAILTGAIPINATALAALKQAHVVTKVAVPGKRKDVNVGGNRKKPSSLGTYWNSQSSRSATAQKKLRKMFDDYADNWTEFTLESPDIQPEDAAFDAADGFWYQSNDIPALIMQAGWTREQVREMLADHIYDAMMKGARSNPAYDPGML